MSWNFKDPTDEDVFDQWWYDIQDAPEDQILNITWEKYPSWIDSKATAFSPGLKQFNENWRIKMCDIFHTTPKEILLVKRIIFPHQDTEGQYKLLNKLCDKLTRYGYCVRSVEHFEKCGLCNCVITKGSQCSCIVPPWEEKKAV